MLSKVLLLKAPNLRMDQFQYQILMELLHLKVMYITAIGATKSYGDGLVGDINTVLESIITG